MTLTVLSKTFPLGAGNTTHIGRARPSGGGSPVAHPAWLTAQTLNTWTTIPGTFMNSVDPANRADLNPNYPQPAPWSGNGQRSMIGAWNSMGVNQATGEVWIGGVGGHADYGGNEVNTVHTKAESTTWLMRRPPSGAIGYPITDGQLSSSVDSSSGVFSDGRPRPTHTYNGMVYVPGLGLVITSLEYVWPNLGGPRKSYLFNENTNDWELFCDYSALGDACGAINGACYDSKRHCVWIMPNGAYAMLKIDCTTRVASRHGEVENHAASASTKYDVANDLVIITSSSGPGNFDANSRQSYFDPTNDLFYVCPPYTGSLPAGMSVNGGGVGWDAENKRLILWGGPDRKALGILTQPAGNPRSQAWVASSMPIDASNTITPSEPTSTGTYGRGTYVDALGGYLLLNANNENFYFFKTKVLP